MQVQWLLTSMIGKRSPEKRKKKKNTHLLMAPPTEPTSAEKQALTPHLSLEDQAMAPTSDASNRQTSSVCYFLLILCSD